MRSRICVLFLVIAAVMCQAQQSVPLRLVQTITLPVVTKFDHMAIDPGNNRAFVAASTHGTVEVIDLTAGKWITSITGPGKPAGLVYSKKCDCIAYSTDSGAFRILNPNTFKVDAELTLAQDADSLGLDPRHEVVYVDNGGREIKEPFSRVSTIDLKTQKNLGDIRIEGGRLEHLSFEQNWPRGYVNNTLLNKVMVIDTDQRKVVDSWDITAAKENVAMALDEANHRLFIGCRQPGTLVVLDTQTGKTVAHVTATGNADDLAYDPIRKRIYMSGGEGFVDVFQQRDPDNYVRIAQIPTRAGARTSKWVPEQNRLYVELPVMKPGDSAQVQVYEAVD